MKPVGDALEALAVGDWGHEIRPQFVIFAKDQPEYVPLPALRWSDRILTEWELDEDELARLRAGERLRLWVWMYPHRCAACGAIEPSLLQPVLLEVTK